MLWHSREGVGASRSPNRSRHQRGIAVTVRLGVPFCYRRCQSIMSNPPPRVRDARGAKRVFVLPWPPLLRRAGHVGLCDASCRTEFISFHGTPQAPLGWSVRWCRHWWRRRVGEAAGQPRICRRRRRLGIIRFPPATPAVRWASCLEQLCPKYVPVMPPPSSALSNVRVASYVPALWCSRPRHGLVLLPGPRGDQPRSTPSEPMQSRRRSNSPSSPPRPRPGRGGGRCPASRCRHGSKADRARK